MPFAWLRLDSLGTCHLFLLFCLYLCDASVYPMPAPPLYFGNHNVRFHKLIPVEDFASGLIVHWIVSGLDGIEVRLWASDLTMKWVNALGYWDGMNVFCIWEGHKFWQVKAGILWTELYLPKIHAKALIPRVALCEDRAYEGTEFKWGHMHGSQSGRAGPPGKRGRGTRAVSLSREDPAGRWPSVSREEAPTRNLDLGLAAFRTMQTKFLVFSHLICGTLLGQAERFNTTINAFMGLIPVTSHNLQSKLFHSLHCSCYQYMSFSSWKSHVHPSVVIQISSPRWGHHWLCMY